MFNFLITVVISTFWLSQKTEATGMLVFRQRKMPDNNYCYYNV